MSYGYYLPTGVMAIPYYPPPVSSADYYPVGYPNQNYCSGVYPDQNYYSVGYPDQTYYYPDQNYPENVEQAIHVQPTTSSYQESVEQPIQFQPSTSSYQENFEQPIQVQPTGLKHKNRDPMLRVIGRVDDPEQRGLLAAEYLGSWLGDQLNQCGWLQWDPAFKSVFSQPPAGHPVPPRWNAPIVNAVENKSVAQESAIVKQEKDVKKSIKEEERGKSALLVDAQAYYEDMATKNYRITEKKNEKPPRPRKKKYEPKYF